MKEECKDKISQQSNQLEEADNCFINEDYSGNDKVPQTNKCLKKEYEPMIILSDYRDVKEKCPFHNQFELPQAQVDYIFTEVDHKRFIDKLSEKQDKCKGVCGIVEKEKEVKFTKKYHSEEHVKLDLQYWEEHGNKTPAELGKRVEEYYKAKMK